VKRRDFILALGGAVAWPVAARAQQSGPMPVIGFLSTAPASLYEHRLRPFREGLKETGYVEGQNVEIDYRSAEAQNKQLPGLRPNWFSVGWR
jgi:putative tryptophan/tyrosine transport system substrate-binding protein